jgi:hypothetical protein
LEEFSTWSSNQKMISRLLLLDQPTISSRQTEFSKFKNI